MKSRTDLPELPNYPLVARAYEMARNVTCRSAEVLRFGIVDRHGVISAEGVLRGYSQAAVFGELLRKIGYQEMLPRTAQRMCECHVGFMAPPSLEQATAQPTLPQAVLDVDLWPGIGFETSRRKVAELVE
jgi:hypothetical protein